MKQKINFKKMYEWQYNDYLNNSDFPEDFIDIAKNAIYFNNNGDGYVLPYAFSGLVIPKNFILPEGVKLVGDFAFFDCKINSVNLLSTSIFILGVGAFHSCLLPSNFIIPKEVTVIPINCFAFSTFQGKLIFKGKPILFDHGAFANSNYTSLNKIPRSVECLGDFSLACDKFPPYSELKDKSVYNDPFGCVNKKPTNRTKVLKGTYSSFRKFDDLFNMSDNITKVGVTYFNTVYFSKGIKFSESLKEICRASFIDSTFCGDIIFPESLELIDEEAFSLCSFKGDVDFSKCNTTFSDSSFTSTRFSKNLYMPRKMKIIDSEVFSASFFEGEIIFPISLEEIKDFSFLHARFTNKVILPESLLKIGESSFEGVCFVEDIIIPSSVEQIDDNAFRNIYLINGRMSIPAKFKNDAERIGLDPSKPLDINWY